MKSQLLELVDEHGRELYLEITPELQIVSASKAFADLLLSNPEALVRGLLADYIPSEESLSLKEMLSGFIRANFHPAGHTCPLTLKRNDGTDVNVVLHHWRVFRDAGKSTIGTIVLDNRLSLQIAEALSDDRLYPSLKEDLPISILRKDASLNIIYSNSRFESRDLRSSCFSRDDLKCGRVNDFSLYPLSLAKAYREDDRRVLAAGVPLSRTELHQSAGGHDDLVHTLKRPILGKDGKPSGIEIAFWSVTAGAEVLLALQQAREQFYRELLDRVPVHIYRKDANLRITYANQHHCEHFGKPLLALLGTSDRDNFPPELALQYEKDDVEVLAGNSVDQLEEHAIRNSTQTSIVHVIKKALVDRVTNEVYGLQGVFWEVLGAERESDTEEMRQLDRMMLLYKTAKDFELKAAIATQTARARDGLLKEIHHRVLNNLQRVADVLSLSSTRISDPEALEAMQSCQTRLQAMATVHRLLYNLDSVSTVDIHKYLKALVSSIVASNMVKSHPVTTRCEIAQIGVDVELAVHCGLIVAELLLNSMKHAFVESARGAINVAFSRIGQSQFELIVQDNGKGFDTTARRALASGLGMVGVLVEQQLRGNLTIESGPNGTVTTAQFQYQMAAEAL